MGFFCCSSSSGHWEKSWSPHPHMCCQSSIEYLANPSMFLTAVPPPAALLSPQVSCAAAAVCHRTAMCPVPRRSRAATLRSPAPWTATPTTAGWPTWAARPPFSTARLPTRPTPVSSPPLGVELGGGQGSKVKCWENNPVFSKLFPKNISYERLTLHFGLKAETLWTQFASHALEAEVAFFLFKLNFHDSFFSKIKGMFLQVFFSLRVCSTKAISFCADGFLKILESRNFSRIMLKSHAHFCFPLFAVKNVFFCFLSLKTRPSSRTNIS